MEKLDSDKKPYGIICNVRLWKYIKPKLQEWKYHSIKGFPEDEECRVLVKDINEFLTKAAELMGFTYTDHYTGDDSNIVTLTVEQIEDILDIPHGNLIII